MSLTLRNRVVRLLALGAALAAVAGVGTACETAPVKSISGTVAGVDGRYVDVMLGFDVLDSAGRKIDMGLLGKTGYSTIQRINHCVPAAGTATATTCTGKPTTYNWSLKLPSNASKVYVEVYPKNPTPTSWVDNYRGFTGPAAGDTNTAAYGMTFRRAIPVGGAVNNVTIRLPKVCGTAGGTTGSLTGHISGMGGVVGEVDIWSMAPDGSLIMGFGIGRIDSAGNYRVNGLQSGQRYGLIAHAPGRATKNVVDYRRATSNDTLIATACSVKSFSF